MSGKLQSGDQPDPNKYDRNRMYGRLSVMSWREREEYLFELRYENDRDMIKLFHEVNIGLDKERVGKMNPMGSSLEMAELFHNYVRENLSTINMTSLLEFHDMSVKSSSTKRNTEPERIARKTRTLLDGEIRRRGGEKDMSGSKLAPPSPLTGSPNKLQQD